MFFTELLTLCESDDASLQKLPCYKAYTNLTDLRKSALKALSACHYIPECRDKIFNVLYKVLNTVPVSQVNLNCNASLVVSRFLITRLGVINDFWQIVFSIRKLWVKLG